MKLFIEIIMSLVFISKIFTMNERDAVKNIDFQNQVVDSGDGQEENIMLHLRDGLKNPAIAAYYHQDIEDVKRVSNGDIQIDYYDVDLNGDGMKDKIVMIRSPLHSGSMGDSFQILLNDGTDNYDKIFYGVYRFYAQSGNGEDILGGVTVLKNKTNDFYDIKITTDGNEIVLRYMDGEYRQVKAAYKNDFFYQFDEDELALDVVCELNYFEGFFSGNGTLKISKIKDTKIDGFYEMSLTNMSGNCQEHGDDISSECIYSGEFPIGYFYVSENRIYMMSYDEDYLPLLCEMTSFPSTKLIEQWNTRLREEGAHRGYFGYRLCCADEGMEDTFGKERNTEEIVLYGEMTADYHNYIEVKEDKRLFKLYPDKIMGTQEHMEIMWEKNQGIMSFAKWAGNRKNYISFRVIGTDINNKFNATEDFSVGDGFE